MKQKYLLDTNICIFMLKNKYDVHYRKVLPIYPALPIFGDIRAELEEKGRRIDDFDILIGATAIKNNVVLVTDNIKHLERLPNIKIENWIDR